MFTSNRCDNCFGAYLAIKGHITPGELVAFSGYINFIIWPIRHLARIIVDLGKVQLR